MDPIVGTSPFLKRGAGFPTVVANMGSCGPPIERSSFKFDGGGLKSKHGGSMGELKMLPKNTCEGLHLTVKLRAVSLQASKN